MSMMRFEKIAARVAVGALALVSLLSMTASARPQEAERPYPKMLPLSQYLMDQNAAIALARSAAPEGISKDASVLVLTPKGWETAVKGTNGFVCMAGPSWTASIDFYDVWSPKQKGALCLNPAAVRSILPIFQKLTQMTLAGVTSVKERIAGMQEAYAKKEIPSVEPGAMSYMMSKDAYLTHLGQSHNLCHVMLFLPVKDPAELNANDPKAPIFSTRSEEHTSELQSQFHLVCRLLLEKKKKKKNDVNYKKKIKNIKNTAHQHRQVSRNAISKYVIQVYRYTLCIKQLDCVHD